MRHAWWWFMPAGLVLAAALASPAGAAVYGAQGLISVPSALVPPARTAGIGATTFDATKEDATGREHDWQWTAASLDVGVAGRAELGAVYLRRSGWGKELDGVGGFGKAQLVTESARRPAISLGVDAISGDLETSQLYLVGTKRFLAERTTGSVTATLGGIYAWSRDGHDTDDGDVYCGLQLGLAPHLSVVGEWRERTRGFPEDGIGGMVMFGAARYAVGVGVLNTGNSSKPGFFIGAGFNVSTFD